MFLLCRSNLTLALFIINDSYYAIWDLVSSKSLCLKKVSDNQQHFMIILNHTVFDCKNPSFHL